MQLSKKQSRVIVAAVFLLFALLVFSLLSKNKSEIPVSAELEPAGEDVTAVAPSITSTPIPSPTSTPDVVLNEFHRIETKNGKPVWEVRAKEGQYEAATSSAVVQDANLSLYRSNGEVVQISAQRAALSLKGGSLGSATLTGDVRIAIKDKIEAFSSEAFFDRVKNKVSAPSHVRIKNNRMEIEGDVFEGDIDTQVFTILRNVSTVIKSKED